MLEFLKSGYRKIKAALSKSRALLGGKLKSLLGKPLDDETFQEIERILYEADLGSELSIEMASAAQSYFHKNPEGDLVAFLKEEALSLFDEKPPSPSTGSPTVILIVGVNGSGKTTSIAKLAHLLKKEGKKVMLAAGDTFRAAAIEQLGVWAERLDIPLVKGLAGGDPAAVAHDALSSAKAKNIDTLIIDTAGRLQNKTELMQELKKITTVLKKISPDAPHETLLSIDATSGQNAVDQAEVFHSFTPLTGIILNKLDGSAKGGVALAIYKKHRIPIRYIGLGEGIDDLQPFESATYVEALFE